MAELFFKVYGVLLPISWLAVAIVLFILLPLSAFQRTRDWSSAAIVLSSFLFGITTWLLGAGITLAVYGWWVFMAGVVTIVGVVPMGIAAAYFELHNNEMALSLGVMLIVTVGTKVLGLWLSTKADDKE